MMRVVFIGGASRSGSTLLDRMFGAADGVASLGELHNIWSRGFSRNDFCGCGDRFSECQAWREVAGVAGYSQPSHVERVLAVQRRTVRTRLIPRMMLQNMAHKDHDSHQKEYEEALEGILTAAVGVFKASTLVDSSKRAAHGHLLRAMPSVDLSVLHLVRDSRAMAHSAAKSIRKTDAGGEHLMAQLTPIQSARGWIQQNLLTEHLATLVPRSTRVRYEDLVTSPRETMERIGEDLGIPIDLSVIDGNSARLPVAHTVSGNPMRMQTGGLELLLDEQWRKDLPSFDRSVVTAMTAPLLLRYGYRL